MDMQTFAKMDLVYCTMYIVYLVYCTMYLVYCTIYKLQNIGFIKTANMRALWIVLY